MNLSGSQSPLPTSRPVPRSASLLTRDTLEMPWPLRVRTPALQHTAAGMSCAVVFADLFKARLTCLVLLTTMVGFYVGTQGAVEGWLLLHTLAGTALMACGASALNQLIEREQDAQMRRTVSRPLPSGRLQPQPVLFIGGGFCLAGLLYLAVAVNTLTSLLGGLTVGLYLLVYTPLKRVTWLNTLVGAIPGALPPLMGWTAARDEVAMGGLILFAIQFCWQIPHFLAIAWMYREDYARAGFRMLPLIDGGGQRTGRHAVAFALGLMGLSLVPAWLGLAGTVYLAGAFLLGLVFVCAALLFACQRSLASARRLFFASILYLPLCVGLMVLNKLGTA